MFCTYCGAASQANQRYCGSCGNAAPPGGAAWPGMGRAASRQRTLGVLWIAYSVLGLLRGGGRLVGAGIGRLFGDNCFDGTMWGWHASHLFGTFLWTLGTVGVVLAAVGLVAGFGLLEHHEWARSLALALGVIALVHPVLGTALGIYTLWVLLPAHAEG